MNKQSVPELARAIQTIDRLASNGNRLAQSLMAERLSYKQNYINDCGERFDLVFYYNPDKSASWGTHRISFEGKSFTNDNACYTFEQHQVRFLESEVSVYQNFMKDFFDILSALVADYRTRNPLNDYGCDY